ncbi:hypothetical protein K8R78_01700 [bacterium]|nr:hypothetical protein [bacterium]
MLKTTLILLACAMMGFALGPQVESNGILVNLPGDVWEYEIYENEVYAWLTAEDDEDMYHGFMDIYLVGIAPVSEKDAKGDALKNLSEELSESIEMIYYNVELGEELSGSSPHPYVSRYYLDEASDYNEDGEEIPIYFYNLDSYFIAGDYLYQMDLYVRSDLKEEYGDLFPAVVESVELPRNEVIRYSTGDRVDINGFSVDVFGEDWIAEDMSDGVQLSLQDEDGVKASLYIYWGGERGMYVEEGDTPPPLEPTADELLVELQDILVSIFGGEMAFFGNEILDSKMPLVAMGYIVDYDGTEWHYDAQMVVDGHNYYVDCVEYTNADEEIQEQLKKMIATVEVEPGSGVIDYGDWYDDMDMDYDDIDMEYSEG